MRIINKKDMQFTSGYLTDAAGNCLNTKSLMKQANVVILACKIMNNPDDMAELMKPYRSKPSTLVVEQCDQYMEEALFELPETPLADAKADEAVAFIEEQRRYDEVVKKNNIMWRFEQLIGFIKDDMFLLDEEATTDGVFAGDPRDITITDVKAAVEFILEHGHRIEFPENARLD